MATAVIGFPDYSDTITWSGPSGAWEADYPATNAADSSMGLVARSTDATEASTQLSGALASAKSVDLCAAVLRNPSITAQVKFVLKDSGGTELDNSGWLDVFDPQFAYGSVPYSHPAFWTGFDGSPLADAKGITKFYQFASPCVASTVEVFISDTSNSDGYVDVSYLAVALGRSLTYDPLQNAEIGFFASRTRARQAIGGAKYFDRRSKANGFRGTVKALDNTDALDFRFELDRVMDLDKPFIWWPFPDDTSHTQKTAFIARNRRISQIRLASWALEQWEFPLDLEEVI